MSTAITCKLTPLNEAHLEAVITLQHSLMPAKKYWTMAEARSTLMDTVHRGGQNVLLAWDTETEKLQGVGAWIIGGNGESFGAPLLVATDAAAAALLAAIEQEARIAKAAWLRVIALISEVPKARTLEARGFRRTFDFVEFEINPGGVASSGKDGGYPDGLMRVAGADVDFKKYIEVGNLSFAGIDNALPLTEDEARDIWKNECDLELSQVVADGAGRYVGFTVVTSKGYIDSVGVHPDCQGRGIARALYQAVMRAAAKRGIERLHTVVSSNNVQSLRLHEKMGFRESERRQVWELGLSIK